MNSVAPLTRNQFVWKVGVLYWGRRMVILMTILGLVVPWLTMGKTITLGRLLFSLIVSTVVMLPLGAVFGFVMWEVGKRIKK